MSLPNSSEEGFRPEFVDEIVGFFGDRFEALHPKERAHAVGVVANTLASLAVNQTGGADRERMTATLATLSDSTNETVETFVQDESVSYLFPQSARICEVIRDAISSPQT